MDICPFTKQPCGQQKVMHVTELKDGVFTELHMCQQCAGQYMNEPHLPPQEPDKPTPPSVGGLLGLLALMFLGSAAAKKREAARQNQPQPQPKCPGCGSTPDDIIKTGRFGCAQCYEYYKNPIQNLLVRYQGGAIKHVGKRPKGFDEAQEKRRLEQEAALDVEDQIKSLEAKMTNAVKVENYEVAGVLKKKIEELRKRLTCEPSPTPPSSLDQ
jgi:protein arginine kinase activator